MNYLEVPPRSEDGNVHVIVEIPFGSRHKYEFDKDLGLIKLDRVLYSAVYYPAEYGFVPQTKSQDGELLDALVLATEPTFPGCLVEARLLGSLTIEHSSGLPEQKLLAVPVSDPRYEEYQDLSDVRGHVLKEIEHFFDVFKDLEGSDVGSRGWEGAERASEILDEAIRAHAREE